MKYEEKYRQTFGSLQPSVNGYSIVYSTAAGDGIVHQFHHDPSSDGFFQAAVESVLDHLALDNLPAGQFHLVFVPHHSRLIELRGEAAPEVSRLGFIRQDQP